MGSVAARRRVEVKLYIVAVAQQKGGAGKTTLSTHLGCAAQLVGTRTVFFDCDPQGTLGEWWKAREAETPALSAATVAQLPERLKELGAAGYQLAVIDTPPGVGPEVEKILKLADLVLVPVRPSPNDLRAVGGTIDLVKKAGRRWAFIANAVKSRSNLTAQAVAALSVHGQIAPVLVGDRTDFVASMTDGRTALETAPASKGAAEIRALWTWVRGELVTVRPAEKKVLA